MEQLFTAEQRAAATKIFQEHIGQAIPALSQAFPLDRPGVSVTQGQKDVEVQLFFQQKDQQDNNEKALDAGNPGALSTVSNEAHDMLFAMLGGTLQQAVQQARGLSSLPYLDRQAKHSTVRLHFANRDDAINGLAALTKDKALQAALGKPGVAEPSYIPQKDGVPVLADEEVEQARGDAEALLRLMYPRLPEEEIESLTPEVVLQTDGSCLFGVRVDASRDNDPQHTKKKMLSTAISSALFAEGLRNCHEAPQLLSRDDAQAADAIYQHWREQIEGPMEQASAEASRDNAGRRSVGLPVGILGEHRAMGGAHAMFLDLYAAQTPAYIAFHSVEDMKRALGSLHTTLEAHQGRVTGPLTEEELKPLQQQLAGSAEMLGCAHVSLQVAYPDNQCALHIVTGGDEDNSKTVSLQLAEHMCATLARSGIQAQLSEDSTPANATLIFESSEALRAGLRVMEAHRNAHRSSRALSIAGDTEEDN